MNHELDAIKEVLETEYLPKARWWPWKNSKKHLDIKVFSRADSLIFLIFKVDGLVFQLPLISLRRGGEFIDDRSFCINNECFLEAEYHPGYIEAFERIEGARLQVLARPPGKILRASPVTLESTNVVSLLIDEKGGKYVLKSYRLLPETNMEALMIKALVKNKFKHIPNVYLILEHKGLVSGILMEYVEGVGDGGYPFYRHLINYLKGSSRVNEILGLSASLGVIIGEMHKALNIGHENSFYGQEEIGSEDTEIWMKRMNRYYEETTRRLDESVGRLESSRRISLEKWRGIFEKHEQRILDEVSSFLKAYEGLEKGRIHQDLHLAQMIFVPSRNDFIITDFEGEPGRAPEERLMKEPLLRDLATMIRSYHYLAHAGVMNHFAIGIDHASDIMVGNDPTLEWRMRNVMAMVNAYLASTAGSNLLKSLRARGVKKVHTYLYPWIVERALYEAYYESMYRIEWFSIPVAGLLDPLLKYLK
ncbi:MAG: alpha-amylase [Thermosphaera sp.]